MTAPTEEKPASAQPESDTVTIQDIADMAGKHINTIRHWARLGIIPGNLSEPWRKKNRTWDRRTVEEWLEDTPQPRSDDLFTMRDIARILGIGTRAVRYVVAYPSFPKPRMRRKWRKDEVREWNNTPRCTYGTDENACWEEATTNNEHGLLMCPKHAARAEKSLRRKTPHHD